MRNDMETECERRLRMWPYDVIPQFRLPSVLSLHTANMVCKEKVCLGKGEMPKEDDGYMAIFLVFQISKDSLDDFANEVTKEHHLEDRKRTQNCRTLLYVAASLHFVTEAEAIT